jgi:hypothetical protein
MRVRTCTHQFIQTAILIKVECEFEYIPYARNFH